MSYDRWGVCLKRGWKVFTIYDSEEEANKHIYNHNKYEARRIIECKKKKN